MTKSSIDVGINVINKKTSKIKKNIEVFEKTYDGVKEKFFRINNGSLDLIEFLRDCLNIDSLFDNTPEISMFEVYSNKEYLKTRAARMNKTAILSEMMAVLETEHSAVISQSKNMIDNGFINFDLLPIIFGIGKEIEIHDGETVAGGKIIKTEISRSFFGISYKIVYESVSSNGKSLEIIRNELKLPYWRGTKKISAMPVRPLTPEKKKLLTERGYKYAGLTIGANYLNYTGHMSVKTWVSWVPVRANGRIMIDVQTYAQFQSNDTNYDRDPETNQTIQELTDDNAWKTEPFVKGFSFVNKMWGKFLIDQIEPIKYDEDAFDLLVLPNDKKKLIKALVSNGTSGFSDIISGKGGGCIFLLHGDPGTGKTLTAEAIAELLHRPLYSISVGELGVNTDYLESQLRKILDLSQIWDAVLLIDEADIFLEKRTSGDILRNSMVSVFLRLLEYHQGVLFLTTNRVKEFDPAFHSRISIALKYSKLSKETRKQIWTNLLHSANVVGIDVNKLSEVEINGRQIKNTIRLSQGLAKQDGVPVDLSHIQTTLEISRQFKQDTLED